MDEIMLRANQIKSLIALAEERNLPCSITSADVDEVISEDTDALTKLRTLGRVHQIVHEIIYAPPGRS